MKQVDELIRGELSAIESFDTVSKKIKNAGELTKLSAIRQDHVHEYKEALTDDGVRAEVKQLIRTQLIPRQERHLVVIENYLH